MRSDGTEFVACTVPLSHPSPTPSLYLCVWLDLSKANNLVGCEHQMMLFLLNLIFETRKKVLLWIFFFF